LSGNQVEKQARAGDESRRRDYLSFTNSCPSDPVSDELVGCRRGEQKRDAGAYPSWSRQIQALSKKKRTGAREQIEQERRAAELNEMKKRRKREDVHKKIGEGIEQWIFTEEPKWG
jgi:hypothetical protein